jgi:hypothetical protein
MKRRSRGTPHANENFPRDCVQEPRQLGHDVLTVQENAQGGGEDEQVLAYATSQNRAVVTFNRRHFIKLHNTSQEHAGIMVCTFDADFASLAARIHVAIADLSSLAGLLIRVNRPGG